MQKRQEYTKTGLDSMKRYNDNINPDSVKNPRAAVLEERILGILMLYPEHIPEVLGKISPCDFVTDFNRSVYEKLVELYNSERFDLSYLNEFFSAEQIGRVQEMVEQRRLLTSNGIETLMEAVAGLRTEKEAANSKDADTSFLDRINASKAKKKSVKNPEKQ